MGPLEEPGALRGAGKAPLPAWLSSCDALGLPSSRLFVFIFRGGLGGLPLADNGVVVSCFMALHSSANSTQPD